MAKKKDAALALAKDGYWVFPLRPDDKRPAVREWKRKATRDAERIKRWWDENPDYNIGVWTERYGDNGALVVPDVDCKGGKPGYDSLLRLELDTELPTTAEQTTASGGRHLIYSVPQAVQGGVDVLGAGIDLRSRGQYIVGPGSVVNGVAYKWCNGLRHPAEAPVGLLERLQKGRNGRGRTNGDARANGGAQPAAAAVVAGGEAVLRAVRYALYDAQPAQEGAGGDAQTYKVACALRDYGLNERQTFEVLRDVYNQRCSPPWSDGELRAKARNAAAYATGAAGQALPEADFESDNALMGRIRLGSQIAAAFEAVRHTSWTIEGILREGMPLCVMYGAPKTGKSFIGQDIALHVAMGRDWHGHKTKQKPVLYVAAEGQIGVLRRIMAWAKKYDITEIPPQLALLTVPVNLGDKKAVKEFCAAVKELEEKIGEPFGLIVFDTLARCTLGLDENDTRDMNSVVHALNTIHAKTKASTLVIHHSGKDARKGARGSMALLGAVDLEIRVTAKGGIIRVECANSRDQEAFKPISFELEAVTIRIDEDLGSEGSMVPVLVADPVSRALTAQQATALDVLQELAKEYAGQWVPMDEWKRGCWDELTNGGWEARRKAFRRARDMLIELGLVEVEGDAAVPV